MGLLDVLNGMRNGPRGGPSGASTSGSSSGGMSPITMAILALLAYKGIKHLGGAQAPQPTGNPQRLPDGSTTAAAGGGGLGDILGGLLGGGAAPGGRTAGAAPGVAPGAGSLGDLLGGLLGGGAAPGGRVAPGARGEETRDRRRHGKPFVEAEGVVDVVDVPERHAEVLLDALRVQDETIDDQIRRARGEAVADRKQVAHVAVFFRPRLRPRPAISA